MRKVSEMILGAPPARRRLGVGRFGVALLAVAALVVAGCGSSSSSSSSTSSASSSEAAVSTASSATSAAKPTTVALLLSGTTSGDDYDQTMDNALTQAANTVGGGHFKIRVVPNVPYTTQATQIVEQLAREGVGVIVDAGGYGSLLSDGCKAAPDLKCLDYGTQLTSAALNAAPNLGTYYVDQAPMFYVEGAVAGKLTKTGTLGFISSFKVPFNTAVVNAFALGCQSTHPGCKVRNVYINSYYNPPQAVEATRTLINSGADIIAHFLDDISPLKTAQALHARGFGFYVDHNAQVPEAWITGILTQSGFEQSLQSELQAIANGTWKPGTIDYGPAAIPDLQLASWGKTVPTDVQSYGEGLVKQIQGGENPFKGPITDASGKVRIPAGQSIGMRSVYMYAAWTWPVQGVTGL